MCFWGTSYEFERNFSKAEFHRKRGEGWDMYVTSAALLWVGIFGRTWVDAVLPSWPGQNQDVPGAHLLEDCFGEPHSPYIGVGRLDLPSGSDRRPQEPEFFLEGVQLVQSWLGPGALVGEKGSY